MKARDYKAEHFLWSVDDDGVATLTLNRPERKNPLTFESYAEMRDLFRALVHADDCKVVIVTGAGGNFSSGGDVHEIIGPLTEMDMPALLNFTRMTGDLVKAMRGCPQPVIAALDGVCVGAGAIMAMASAHERWIEAVFADLSDAEADELTRLLERAKRSLHLNTHQEPNG